MAAVRIAIVQIDATEAVAFVQVRVAHRLPIDADHASPEHNTPVFLEGLDPDNQVGNAALILDRDEHHPFCRAGALTNEKETGRFGLVASITGRLILSVGFQ
jgi:hypothetical protein